MAPVGDVLQLVSGQGAVGTECLQTLRRILGNIVANPNEDKYRSVRVDNATVKRNIVDVKGAVDLLVAVGFEKVCLCADGGLGQVGDRLVLGPQTDLERVKTALAHIESQLAPASTSTPPPSTSTASGLSVPRPPVDVRSRSDPAAISKHQSLVAVMKSNCALVYDYEDKALQDAARRCVPTFALAKKATAELHEDTDLRDELLRQLLRWFKTDFFTWVNSPPCDFCQGPTKHTGMGTPTPQETHDGAGRVEVYQCTLCNSITRFPRYGRPKKLLETRRGRCGEWANCFTLLCRALGYDARYVWDETDHVWTEVWSNKKQRWLHCDSCEAALDQPLTYESGWGKKLSYIFAFSVDEVVDVTRRYTLDLSALTPRRPVPEDWLAETIAGFEQQQQFRLSAERKSLVKERKRKEEAELSTPRLGPSGDELSGRQSGSVEWRQARQEMGAQGGVAGPEAPGLPVGVGELRRVVDTGRSTEGLRAVGDAAVVGVTGTLVLTANRPDQTGAVWAQAKAPTSQGFVTEFGVRMASNGADGMAFVLQNHSPDAIGGPGNALGYGGIANCLAVEFDTYESLMECDDPSNNHISVLTNGRDVLTSHHRHSLGHTNRIPRLNSGLVHRIRIVYEPKEKKLSVDMRADGSGAGYKRVLQVNVCLADTLAGGDVWVGFTGATGGLAQTHEVVDWTMDMFTQ